MQKRSLGIIVAVVGVAILAFIVMLIYSSSFTREDIPPSQHPPRMKLEDLAKTMSNYTGKIVMISLDIEGTPETLPLPTDAALFKINYTTDSQGNVLNYDINLKPELTDFYHQVGFFNRTSDAVVIYPIFTQAAYHKNGFYDYYDKICDSRCLTTNIPTAIHPRYQSSGSALTVLFLMNYDIITDIDVDRNPHILKKYNEVIV